MNDTISKSHWLTWSECRTKAWRDLRTKSAPSEAERFRMEQGREVGALARTLYPDGILVNSATGETAIEETKRLIANSTVSTLFEPAFRAGHLTTKADILARSPGGWHLIEVKSSFSDTSRLKELIDDVAYTALVVGRAGVLLQRISLLLLTREYRHGDTATALFQPVDVTGEALTRVGEFEQIQNEVETSLLTPVAPEPTLVSACRSCESFEGECLGKGISHTVLELPSLHYTRLKKLSAEGIVAMHDVPPNLQLNELQIRVREAALSGSIWVNPTLGDVLEAIKWPCHYLDLETVATVLPLYPGGACHEQILTQFSIHHRPTPDGEVTHSEYLADPLRNCELEFAERLLAALGDKGSIVVYTEFEQTRIKALLVKYPQMEAHLTAILERLVDLHPIVRDNIYHPEFRGSFSIKRVLPALVKDPELSYENLPIGDGDSAVTAFARMARKEITGQAAEETKRNLLRYCKLDTLAMVRLHEVLQQRAGMAIGA